MSVSDRLMFPSQRVDAQLQLFPRSGGFDGVWSQVVFYLGTFERQARVHLLDCDKLSGGQTALVQIDLDVPCSVIFGDRFVIRNTSSDLTLGGGLIVDAFPLHHRKRPARLVEELQKLADSVSSVGRPERGVPKVRHSDCGAYTAELANIVAWEVRKRAGAATHVEIADRLGLSADEVFEAVSGRLPSGIVARVVGDAVLLIGQEEYAKLRQQVIQWVEDFHQKNPFEKRGLASEELASLLGIQRGSPAEGLLRLLLESLVKDGRLRRVGHTLALAETTGELGPQLQVQVSLIAELLETYRMKTPLMSELVQGAARKRIDESRLRGILHRLVEDGVVYFADGNYIHRTHVDRCRRALLAALMRQPEGLTVAGFRNLVSGNRKICLLLLQIYDGEGIVQRTGDLRRISEKGKTAYAGEASR